MLPPGADYASLVREFRWQIPARYNMGVDVCDRHADGSRRPALIFVEENGAVRNYSFDDLKRLSNQFANVLVAHGMQRGDRMGVLLPQSPETAIAHIAAFKAGLISIP
ncbi:MAG: acyl-CoA synthetase, partial [Acetobacteraceae bacterium]|nr:acyl-CoA synthetase [Acetobacteraceae bacterium]